MTCPGLSFRCHDQAEVLRCLDWRDPASGILITIPPHRGDVTLTSTPQPSHVSEEQLKDKRAAYATLPASVAP